MDYSEIFMPINNDFIEVFKDFMNEDLKNKSRAQNVRQYCEGIIYLLLADKIKLYLKNNDNYESLSWKRKLDILDKYYDKDITTKLRYIFKIGGAGSHFNGKVNDTELNDIINYAIHIVEDIFVKYFMMPEHKFGTENIFTVFSMLPLKHRIYILEKLLEDKNNKTIYMVIEKLALAYVKYGENNKALGLLEKVYKDNVINNDQYKYLKEKCSVLLKNIENLYEINRERNIEGIKAIQDGQFLVVGYQTSKDLIDSKKILEKFSYIYERDVKSFPEFFNLFFYLMLIDERKYK